nr:DNA mismatch repair protein MutS [Balneicella halophila]
MKQYNKMKAQHPDAILLFRVGDFYETFSDDAIKTADILGITLTKRANGAAAYIELAGFPHHAIDTYLPKLVRAGQRVAICEQLEDPKKTKKIVKRGIIELVTPGVSFNDNVLEHKENNFLAAVFFEKQQAGVAFLDVSTGEFYTSQGNFSYIDKLLSNLQPKEVLFERGKEKLFRETFGKYYTFPMEDWAFHYQGAEDKLLQHFQTASLKGFGISDYPLGVVASGAILHYLELTKHEQIRHITSISRIEEGEYVWLDRFTVRNLELFSSLHEGAKTLVQVLDKTACPMGARLLKRWVALPLKEVKKIQSRQAVVTALLNNPYVSEELFETIHQVGDMERIASKAAVGRINPREIVQLKNALQAIQHIKDLCTSDGAEALTNISDQLNPCSKLCERIGSSIVDNPPALLNKGNVIKEGVSEELDELRNISFKGKDYLVDLQQRECERTGIPSLKIAFNNVFGYYLEVRNTHKDKVPEEWIRKQTLVSAERYITEELKEYENKILGAEEKIQVLEQQLYESLVLEIADFLPSLQLDAQLVARLDCLLSFAQCAQQNNYVLPQVNDTKVLDIKEGRHPVIEQQLPVGEEYIANDVYLDNDSQQIIIITGPNMSGKSALLRQTALITLMAQIGSYVPAKEANIGVVDKIFTRVGASDNISMGESTFMVEMNEAASILNNLSDRSLVLFDELGRGTSTYDGISIAWSIVEYIHEQPKNRAKTLFATHYHELNEMQDSFSRVKNYNVSVKEVKDKVIFLRKLVRGGSNHSFGIHVARMAGMPASVVQRANVILEQLEGKTDKSNLGKPVKELAQSREGYQMSFFQLDDPVLTQIRDQIAGLDVNNLTPVEALNILNEIKKLTGK